MVKLSLSLFGVAQAELDGVPVRIRRRKAMALLAYLAVTQQAQSRDVLATLLWPEYDQESARNSLRRTLSSLQRALGRQWLRIDRTQVVMPTADTVWVDVAQYCILLKSARSHDHAPNTLCQDCLSALQQAVALYKNDFLHGFALPDSPEFDEWQRFEQERLRSALGGALEQLAIGYGELLEFDRAVDFARRRLALDPLHEPAHRLLMRLYAADGQMAAALHQFDVCARVLETELGVPVAEETADLMAAIQEGHVGTHLQTSSYAAPATASDVKPPERGVWLPSYLQTEDQAHTQESAVFVARYRELARLSEWFEAAVDGRGSVAFIVGEAGSGKTALVRQFMQQAQVACPDLIVATGACDVYTGAGDPYMPFRDILNMLTADVEMQWLAGTITQDDAQRLWRLLPWAIRALVKEGPELIGAFISGRALHGRATACAAQDAEWNQTLSELKAQERTRNPDQSRLFEAYLNVLVALSTRHPLLLFLDDLHWADASSLGLLFHLGRRIGNARILILGAFRWEEPEAAAPDGSVSLRGLVGELRRRYGDIVVDLDSISPAEARQFVDALLDSSPNRLDEDFRLALLRHGRGHPLFTVELLRHLEDHGGLAQDTAGRWFARSDLGWGEIPARVDGVIARRIERLDETSARILRLASVEGESFTAQVIAAVTGIEERRVIQCLSNELQNRYGLVYAEGVYGIGERRLYRYRFRHNLIQMFLYQSLDPVEKAFLHEQVGIALENCCAGSEEELGAISGQLARHFQEASLAEKAVHYRLVAGTRAIRLSANQEAFAHLQQGLAMLEVLPDTPGRAKQELAYQIALGIPVTATRGYAHADAASTYARASMLSEKVGATPEQFPSLFGLWRFQVVHSGASVATELAARISHIAQQSGEASLMVEAKRTLGVTLFHAGKLAAARLHLEQGLALYDRELHRDHAYLYGHDPAVSLLAYLAHAECLLGNPKQGSAHIDELLDLAHTLSHPLSLAYALNWGAAVFYQLTDQPREVLTVVDEGLAITNKHTFSLFDAQGVIMRGWALATLGEMDSGIATMRDGITAWLDTGAAAMSFYHRTLLAAVHAEAGDTESGLRAVEQALAIAQDTGNHFYMAESYRVRGELLHRQGQWQAAEASLNAALATARQQEAKLLELRAAESLTQLVQQQSRRQAASA